FSGHFLSEVAFLYDPLSRKIQYGGDTLDIQEIASAVYSLKRSLQDEFCDGQKDSLQQTNLPKRQIAA
ncbi:MAG: hypothetical protein JW902_10085, partial [Syntrophaceae bacterium]|nr:hypothetical protein [Syntrophaceae bacterium]